jgi:fructose-1,6-bisphosphatase/inositol monophosphatase family enzyme
LCTILIATEAGAIITNLDGKKIDYPFDTDAKCGFIAYANQDLQNLIEPILLPLLK